MANVAVVTGATSLLGRQVTSAFQSAGWQVVGTGFTRAELPAMRKLNLEDQPAVVSMLDEVK